MTRPNIILRIVIPATLIAAVVFSLIGRLLAATPPAILVDTVQVRSCGAVWTTDRRWIACVIKRDGFDGP